MGIIHALRDEGAPGDKPVTFGSNVAWLAVETTDTQRVATTLGLRRLREATWKEGVDAAYRSSVFVTPPLGDWTLAVGTPLLPPEGIEAFVKPLLEQLSREFRDAQYFCTHREAELHVWARAKKGKLLRGYGWLGEPRRILWNEGPQTKDERNLGIRFTDGRTEPVETEPAEGLTNPDEGCVMQLALLWSIDPTSLDEHFQEPVMGLLGAVDRSKAE
ncbi:MAG: hypothetical protein L0241_32260 [Planctomycetia bacterium]|nr:hypothetical protein [Planctomycetia bacterium]